MDYYLLICAMIVFCFGYKYDTLYILMYVSVIDMFVGSVRAMYKRKFKLKYLRIGITKKVFQIFVVSLSYQIDKIGIVHDINFFVVVCYAYIVYEVSSILTNLKKLGVFVPAKFLEKMK